jgi:hypothetical protein
LGTKHAHIIIQENLKKNFKDGVTGTIDFVRADPFPGPSAVFWCSRKTQPTLKKTSDRKLEKLSSLLMYVVIESHLGQIWISNTGNAGMRSLLQIHITLMLIWIRLLNVLRIRSLILLLINVMPVSDHYSRDPLRLRFEPPRLLSEIPQPSVAPFWASTPLLRASMAIYGYLWLHLSLHASITSFYGYLWLHFEPPQLLNFDFDASGSATLNGIVSRKIEADPDRFVSSGARPVADLLVVVDEDFS